MVIIIVMVIVIAISGNPSTLLHLLAPNPGSNQLPPLLASIVRQDTGPASLSRLLPSLAL